MTAAAVTVLPHQPSLSVPLDSSLKKRGTSPTRSTTGSTTGSDRSSEKEASRHRRASFVSLRHLSSSFSKTRCSHNRKVSFQLEDMSQYPLPPIEDDVRPLLWMTYLDKVSSADDVEETCYNFNDTDFVHPYVQQLDQVWDQCASPKEPKPLHLEQEDLTKLVSGKGRGLEKKLLSDMKKNRETIVKQVLDAQKSYRNLPIRADQKAKMLKNKYKKLTTQSKVFALTLAKGDAQVATKLYGNTIAATSA